MAYMSQERKAKLLPAMKAVCDKFGVKASYAVRNHSTLVISVKQGKLDFIENFIAADQNSHHARKMEQSRIDYLRSNRSLDVNPYWFQEHFTGGCKDFLTELFAAAKGTEWYDRSDAMTDYFDTAYYIDVNVGSWDKPYALVK